MKKWEKPQVSNLNFRVTNEGFGINPIKKDKTDCCNHNITNELDYWAEGNHHGWCCEWRNHEFGTNNLCS